MEKTLLQKLLEETDYNPRSYSGRGMYGEECLAVVTDDLGELLANVMDYAIDVLDDKDMHTLAESFRCMISDSMGMGTVYYFPDLKFVEE